MSTKPSIPKGTRDFGPEQMARRAYLIDQIKAVFKKYCFLPIETPSMENLSTLTGKYGEEGDQLLFKVLNSRDFLKGLSPEDLQSGYRQLGPKVSNKGLRYDLTVPFARYVVMHQNDITFPFRRYQIQPVWRGDNPQRGRYREFYQCDADIIGTDSLLGEVEIILLITEVFKRLNLNDYVIQFNNRKILSGIAEVIGAPERVDELCMSIDKLEKIGQEKVFAELESKQFSTSALNRLRPFLNLNGQSKDSLNPLQDQLKQSAIGMEGLKEVGEIYELLRNVPDVDLHLEFDVTLARGLAYYTGTIFEVKPTTVKMGSITAGGRYDNLTGIFGMEHVSGIGISFGIDRIYDVLEELELFPASSGIETEVLITHFDASTLGYAIKTLQKFRNAGISAELYPDAAKMKKQFQYANKRQIPFVVVIGPQEVETGILSLKDMSSGEQSQMSVDEMAKTVAANRI